MKKLLFVLLLSLFLVACGNESDAESGNEEPKEEQKAENDETEEVNNETKENETIDEDEYSFENEYGMFNLVGMYYSEDEDQEPGFYKIDFDGFILNMTVSLVDIELSEEVQWEERFAGKEKVRALLIVTEAENTTDMDIDFNGTSTIVTSDKQQVSPDYGIGSENESVMTYYGQVIQDGFFIVPLDDNSQPESIELMFEAPYEVTDAGVDTMNGKVGEDTEFEMKFISKEEMEEEQ
ncbi:hypothetical protein [Oceanobacillus sp. FSL K6-0251]|uniref:hypothetical protein n=1 Tax=Oceanobacillus sp. FSL K6-0251 TaxID=2921602 RepID=UPI0030F71ED3